MKFTFGIEASAWRRQERVPIDWDSSRLVNGHILMVGMSGAGKTTTIRKMISGMRASTPAKLRIHVFDVHGDMNIAGASSVMFSEQSTYGLNPLRVNPDPHFGGLRKRIQGFLRIINKASVTPLGIKQESVIRNVLYDVYRMHGFKTDDAATWYIDESKSHLISDGSDNRLYLDVPISEKDQAKAFGARFDGDKKLWWVATEHYKGGITRWRPKTTGRVHPAVSDALSYARRQLKMSFLGSDQDAVTALEIYHKHATSHHRKMIEAAKRAANGKTWDDEEADEALEKSASRAMDSYSGYLQKVRTGHELDDLMKYDSVDVLKSVVDRLEGLVATGLFKNGKPPFDESSPIWHYQLKALSTEEKRMFVMFRLEELWAQAIERGEQKDVVEVFVLDEAAMYFDADDSDDSIFSVLARESRKFGVSLVMASQTPAFPESFIGSVGTKVILGVDEMYWKPAASKMRIDEKLLAWIKPTKSMAVQLKERGESKNEWRWVLIPQAGSPASSGVSAGAGVGTAARA
jgi:hypothetical protein